MKSVHRNWQFLIFLVFAKNEAPKGLLGNTLPYNQLIIYILATLCAIFMPLASKLWHSQWFEVGQLAMTKSFFGQIWLFDHERSPVELSDSYANLFSIVKYMIGHIFIVIGQYMRFFEFWWLSCCLRSVRYSKIIKYTSIALKMCPIMYFSMLNKFA